MVQSESAAADSGPESKSEFQRAVVKVLRSTVPGDVLSYGDVAVEAGYPGAARAVGSILRQRDDLPWWRIVASDGKLITHDPLRQERALAAEGTEVVNGRVVAQTD